MPEAAETRVFLSYQEDDQLAAEEIARRLLKTQLLQVWLRAWSVVPGRLTQEEQERGLAESDACAVLIGSQGVREWQQIEVYASIARRVAERGSGFPVVPVFLPGCPPGVRATLPAFLGLYEPVSVPALDDEEALRRLACGLLGQPPGEEAPADLFCPYPGLDPFRRDRAPYFFGREEEIGELQQLLEVSPFALVLGPSGSGKSSLVLAGLLPRLEGAASESSPALVREVKPGREPLQALAMAFVPQPGDPRRNALAAALAQDERELSRTMQAELKAQPAHIQRIVLLVDQLEELFALCTDAAQRRAFVRNLLVAAEEGDGRARVVFTLRSDFYTRCFEHDDYAPLLDTRRQLPVWPLRGDRLRRAIEESGRAAGLLFQRGLVDTLLDDAGDEPGILPLVQYTLRALFDRRSGRWLTLDAYYDPALGGVRGVVAARAEAALARLKADPKLDPAQVEPIVRRILLRLVQVGENSPPTRQQVAWETFFWASDTPAQRALLEEGLRLLIQERLLTADKDEDDVVQVSLAHEVIIKAWKKLTDWVDESMEDLLTRRRVEEAAREWDRSERDESLLFRGVQLEKALEWQKRRI